ncbi:hypothetical protein Lal_00002155 [Lupinus albus]|nr:hypothetical protein Lal_00002155 [Lupinus albus]
MADSVSTRRMWCSFPEKFQLHGAMLALQFGYAGFHVVSRAALNMGVSKLEGEASTYFKLSLAVLPSGTCWDHSQPRFLLAWFGQHIPNIRISNTKLCPSYYISNGSYTKASP